ncbi:hypothetical protein CRUP_029341, partial [Coryphaenoides rupestris]
DVECGRDTEDTVICELGNPLGSNKRVKLRLIFETREIDSYTRQIDTQLQLSTLSEQSDLFPVPVVLLVELLGTGMGTMGTMAIEFEWPLEVENGKWLLYLTEIVVNGTSENRCVPPGDVVNLLNLTLTEGSSSRRRKRQAVAMAVAGGDPGGD